MPDPMAYISDINRYDLGADIMHVREIVSYCGSALRSRDASRVACSDQAELNRVRDGFCAKKLGLNTTAAEAAIEAICETMKQDHNMQRVTFYYLLAKNSGKLGNL